MSTIYEVNRVVQKIVRMLGAMQLCPMTEWDACLQLLDTEIESADLTSSEKEGLKNLLAYFE